MLLLAGLTVIGVAAILAIRDTRTILREGYPDTADALDAYWHCVQHRIDDEVPAHARVFFATHDATNRQRERELGYLRYELAERASDADWVVDVTPRATCAATDIEVTEQ